MHKIDVTYRHVIVVQHNGAVRIITTSSKGYLIDYYYRTVPNETAELFPLPPVSSLREFKVK
ncbi:hypothetical protein BGW80DRAFT_1401367 [Lactifluus volemus]|nr:hypothetical protein BGW80DRAFT_1401367 [Lactifluus volemus]